jgi:hypothetical protein
MPKNVGVSMFQIKMFVIKKVRYFFNIYFNISPSLSVADTYCNLFFNATERAVADYDVNDAVAVFAAVGSDGDFAISSAVLIMILFLLIIMSLIPLFLTM